MRMQNHFIKAWGDFACIERTVFSVQIAFWVREWYIIDNARWYFKLILSAENHSDRRNFCFDRTYIIASFIPLHSIFHTNTATYNTYKAKCVGRKKKCRTNSLPFAELKRNSKERHQIKKESRHDPICLIYSNKSEIYC